MTILHIDDLQVFANHGVLPEEKILGQKFLVSAHIVCNFPEGIQDDNIDNTINYAKVCQQIEHLMLHKSFNLIETTCDELAQYLLHTYGTLMSSITVTLKKPWAPVGRPLEQVAVSITRSWHTVYLGLGSNLGDTTDNLNHAVDQLRDIGPGVQLVSVSSYLQTKPVSSIPQPDYLNAAVAIRTTLTPRELIAKTMTIEANRGRVREEHWGPRILDIDILAYDQLVTDDPTVTLPHPLMHERGFVLRPLAEIAPLWLHPLLNQRVQSLVERVK